MNEYFIKVGIKTLDAPIIEYGEDYTTIKNVLIGDGFHWQQNIEAKFPGKVIHADSSNKENISLINVLPLEKYLECVVGSEMNPLAPPEFLKAHAVISRSWALGKILGIHQCDDYGRIDNENTFVGWDDTASHYGFNVCSDDHCQRYQGLQPISKEALKAIHETEGEVLKDLNGNLIDARFSKCCGGQTELFSTCWQSRDETCLKSISDPWCDLSSLPLDEREAILSIILKDYDKISTYNYGYSWETETSKKTVGENLKKHFGRDIGDIILLEPLERGPSGRISLLRLHGTKSTLDIGKELWIRRLLSDNHLYSSAFYIEDHSQTLLLKGKGWGHGVGLCQIGAANMAINGFNYKEILSFYYPESIVG